MLNSNTAAKISEAEQTGREKFITIHSGMTWAFMRDRYDVFDLSGSTTTTNMYIEAKARDIPSTKYGTTFLELSKLNNLLDIAAANNGKAFYFVTYNDGKSFLFDLTNVKEKYAIQQVWCNDITIGDNPTERILKDVIHLPLFKANKKYK